MRTHAPPLGTYHLVGGKRLLLYHAGEGRPSVVFIPGAGTVGLDYLNVHERAAALTTAVVYDRAGTGWSDGVSLPRTSTVVTDELRSLLQTAEIPGPYVLVGHSLGGLYARHLAIRFPDDVAGLLLLDPAHEDYDSYMPAELNAMRQGRFQYRLLDFLLGFPPTRLLLQMVPAMRKQQDNYRQMFTQELASWPSGVREVLIERHASPEWLRVGLRETSDLEPLYKEVRTSGSTPDLPLTIVCSTGTDAFKEAVSSGESEDLLRQEVDGKRKLYEKLASSVSHGSIVDVDAGHVTMSYRCTDVIAAELAKLLRTARV